jgi:CPA2 family monovalent cation:H+ antiporter-2
MLADAATLLAGSTETPAMLRDVVIALAVALAVATVFSRFRLPPVVGFLAAGTLIGPAGLGLISEAESIEAMAEIGVVFLLFTIGLKFPLDEMIRQRGSVFGVGTLQTAATMTVGAAPLLLLPDSTLRSVLFMGILLALSSTAVVLRVLESRGEAQGPQGRLAISVLIFHDLAAILFILILPVLGAGGSAEGGGPGVGEVALSLLKLLVMVSVLFGASRFILPRVFRAVTSTRSAEIFSLATIVIIMGTAYVAGAVHVSVALGAFLAGMVVADSDFARQVLADVRPIRDTLSSLFFVSIGLLVTRAVWVQYWWLIPLLAAAAIIVKAAIAAGAGVLLGHGVRNSVVAGLMIAQIGEFSFVLAQGGRTASLLTAQHYEVFIAVSVLTMAATPFLIAAAPKIAHRLERITALRSMRHARVDRGLASLPEEATHGHGGGGPSISGHIIVVGYGVNGQNVVRVLREAKVPRIIVELNPHTVRRVRAEGELIFYGDASRQEVLEHAGVERCRAVAVALPDAASAEAVVCAVNKLNPAAQTIVRTRFVREVEPLLKLGATHVVPEEFETSLELATLALEAVGIGPEAVEKQVQSIRDDHYRPLTKT